MHSGMVVRVGARGLVRSLRDPNRLRRYADAATVERRHRHDKALSFLVQQAVTADESAIDP